jgi:hypothetical protein
MSCEAMKSTDSIDRAWGRDRVEFTDSVVLTKDEAFEACETCARAERHLRSEGLTVDAARLALLFELLEGRLAGG